MRASLYALLLGSLLGCAKKSGVPTDNVTGAPTTTSLEKEASPSDKGERGAPATALVGGVDRGGAGAAADVMKQPAPAGVRAGEWDDNANYRDFVKWLADSPKNVARLDVSDRQFVVVKDKDGKGVPNCRITLDDGTTKVSLVTTAAGRALWFPHAYKASTKTQATAHCGNQTASANIDGQLDTVTQLVLTTARDLPARRTIDLAFVLDTTGSMSEEIEAVKQTIRAVASQLSSDQTDVRIGLIEYKDRTDQVVAKTYPFSSDLAAFATSIDGIVASGGGDLPEDMQRGVSDALDRLQWRDDAVARMVVVIADAPPHLDYQDERSFADSAKLAASRGIKLFTVSASGMDLTGQLVMRQMAQFTGAANMFVLRGGAGPQSVGGGDPQSSCGGTQEQYASGKLDKLIVGKVRQELAALDSDPLRIAGIGKDESAKPCNERIVLAY